MNFLSKVTLFSIFCGALLAACGSSSSSSSDRVALCKQSCGKAASLCFADAGVEGAAIKSACEANCTTAGGTNGTTCTNTNTIVSAVKACLNETTCDGYTNCLDGVPECTGGGAGTGGSTGAATGGTSGGATGGRAGTATGGASGTAGTTGTGTACAEVVACCNTLTLPQLKDACLSAAAGADNAQCTLVLAQYKQTLCP